ncbi:MAG: glycerol kinase GlpK [Candidatus Velthaea sp.]
MTYILALDQGTTSSRALVLDVDGIVCGAAHRDVPQIFPQPGWVEHDPDDIRRTQIDAARDALRAAGIRARDVVALGIANQRETTLVWERADGRAIGNAIVWQDRRTAALCDRLAARGAGERVREVTGLVLDPYFSATKLAWMLEAQPALRARAERGELAFGTVDSWLVWNLTGGAQHVTDYTNASRTLLFDIHARRWSEEMLELFGIPRAMLPRAVPSTAGFGMTRAEVFGAAVPIAAVAGDQQAALAGHAGFRAGIAKNTYGTGSFVMLHTGTAAVRSGSGMLTTVACAPPAAAAAYALEGAIFATGAAVQWLRDGLGIITHAADTEALARSVPDTGDCFFVPAFTGLGAPYWDPHARATLAGVTRGTMRAHVARAVLEAMAYQTADVVRAMERDAGVRLGELRADGGAAANDFVMQFQADILDVPVVRPSVLETTALGAGYLAGLECGLWADVESVAALRAADRRFLPAIDARTRERLCGRWSRAVSAARGWTAGYSGGAPT